MSLTADTMTKTVKSVTFKLKEPSPVEVMMVHLSIAIRIRLIIIQLPHSVTVLTLA